MAIVFQCGNCGRKLEVKETLAGKTGKCPSCQNQITVPYPAAEQEDDELRLAPLDEAEEARRRQLLAETFRIEQDILKQREDQAASESAAGHVGEKELTTLVISYLRNMADGDMGGAQGKLNLITANKNNSRKILDRIALTEIPEPELAEIPPGVLSGLIRTLRNRLT